MWLQCAFVFLKSNFIFSKKRSKVFYFEGPPETRGGTSCACCLFLYMAVDSEFHCSLQELYLHGKYKFNKTILQSIYIIFRLFLLFACLKKFQRLNQNINSRRFIQFLDDLQTINHLLETIEGFTVADVILVVGQTRRILQ